MGRKRGRGRGAAAVFRTVLVFAGVAGASATAVEESAAPAPHQPDQALAARFIVAGDTGSGNERARSIAAQMRRQAEAVPVSHAFLLGDNVYDYGSASDIAPKFLDVYRGVFSQGVRIHAALGNHDVERCRESGLRPVPRDESAYRLSPECEVDAHLATPEFGYRGGFRYYSIEVFGTPASGRTDESEGRGSSRPRQPPLVEVFVLDSNTLGKAQTRLRRGTDEPQLQWLAEALERSSARWKVVTMHHPVRTPKRCRWLGIACRSEDDALGAALEPIFREHGVDVVFQAHQHMYARLKPQQGIRYFISGGGGRKPYSFRNDERTLRREDGGAFNHFVYVRATADRFGYCVIDAEGNIRDSGGFARGDATDGEFEGASCPPP